ncbi:hypothetical protein DSECCO2_334750 [anaerobic digester metagenome]
MRFRRLRRHGPRSERVQIHIGHHLAFGPVDGPLHHVSEFPHIPRPGMAQQGRHGLVRKVGPLRHAQAHGHARGEVPGQQFHVALAFAQGRDGQHLEAQAVQQILLEFPLPGPLRQVGVGRADQTDVDLDGRAATDAVEGPVFRHAEDLFLGLHGQVGDLVQKEGAAVGVLEAPLAPGHGAGEGAGLVPEQLRVQKRPGQGRAIERDEGALPAGRQIVQPRGGEFLAGPALADDEDGPVDARDPGQAFLELQERVGLAEGFPGRVGRGGFHDQTIAILAKQCNKSPSFRVRLMPRPCVSGTLRRGGSWHGACFG